MSDGNKNGTGALSKASNDANQNMSTTQAGSPTQPCGTAPDPASNQIISPSKTHWIAIELADEAGLPMPGEEYRVVLSDGTVVEGGLDGKGRARITGIDTGSCRVSFPNRDAKDWQHI